MWRWLGLWSDALIGAGVALLAFGVYAATLLPGVGSRDTAELQWVVPTLGLAHPTGYPLYTILGWLWSQLPLGGSAAWRMNLFSAVASALAIGVVYHVGRALGQRPLVAAAAAASLAFSLTFWSQATIAEVYGLASLLQALLILALLRWRAARWPLWSVGLLAGLGLAHHRSVVLLAPAALLFVIFAVRSWRLAVARAPRASRLTAHSSRLTPHVAYAALALLAGCLLYLYVPLRAPEWMRSWQQVWDHITGASLTATWLDVARLRAEGVARPLGLLARFVWPQLLPAGALLALLGVGRLLRRDKALAALLLGGYLAVVAFCAAYYVADVEVFFLPAHLLAALLLGEGAMLVLSAAAALQLKLGRRAGGSRLAMGLWSLLEAALLVLPIVLFARNLAPVRALNTSDGENAARAIMAQPLPEGALVIGDWFSTEGPRYLQVVEGIRTDIQFGSGVGREAIANALGGGRAVYLVEPDLSLGLEQWPEGRLWRVGPAAIAPSTAVDVQWNEGIALAGYTLRAGQYAPGDSVPLMLQWQATDTPRHGYWLFVHLVAEDGTLWGQSDQPPAQAPTDQWQPGGRYADLISIALGPGAPAGRYRVNVGWYEYPSMRRLGLSAPAADYATIGEIEVGPPR